MANVPALAPAYNPPALVNSDGKPMRQDILTQEIASASLMSARSILTGSPADGLTPERLAQLLKSAETGFDPLAYLELAEAMEEKDAHYLSVLGTRKQQVAQLPKKVEAASSSKDDERNADLVREWLERDEIEDDLIDMLDGIGKGFSVMETVWDLAPKRWFPERIEHVDPRFITFDQVTGKQPQLRGAAMPTPLADFGPGKFIYHQHKAKSGLPIRGGLARPAAWIYLFKNFGLKDWVIFAEIYGFPIRVGKYSPGATEADIRTLQRAVAAIGRDFAAVIPQSMAMEFVEGISTGNADVFEKLCRYCDEQFSKLVLGQTATTDSQGGGLGGSGKEHNDVRGDIERSDAKRVSATLNKQLVRPMIDWNFGKPADGRYPRIVVGREQEVDDRKLATVIGALVDRGARVSQKEALRLANIPEAADDEPILTPIAGPVLKPADSALADAGGGLVPETAATRLLDQLKSLPAADRDRVAAAFVQGGGPLPASAPSAAPAIEAFTARELGDWEVLVAPMLAPVEDLLANCATLEEARDRLAETLAAMDTAKVAEILARGGFAARLAGAAGDA